MKETTTFDDPSGGDLVQVAFTGNLAEGEMIQGLLRADGISSLLQPTGINGPLLGIGLLPHCPQRVMVRASQAEAARHLLAGDIAEKGLGAEELADAVTLEDARGRGPRSYGLIGGYARIWFWSLVALGVAFGVFLLSRAA